MEIIGKKSREKRERRERLNEVIELYTIKEVAEIMRVTPTTIRNWIRAEQLKVVDISTKGSKQKKHRIKREELERIINN